MRQIKPKRPKFKPSATLHADLRLLHPVEIEGIFAGGGFPEAFFSRRFSGLRRRAPGQRRFKLSGISKSGVPVPSKDLVPGDAVLLSLRLPDRGGVVSTLAEVAQGRLNFVAMAHEGFERLIRWIAASA